jgi:hypothetical protein
MSKIMIVIDIAVFILVGEDSNWYISIERANFTVTLTRVVSFSFGTSYVSEQPCRGQCHK